MSFIFTARKNQKILVTDKQFQIIIGSLLGDAYISNLGKIQFEQCDKQKEYLEWKFEQLKSISYEKIGKVKRVRNDKTYYSYRFFSRQFFRPLRDKFYLNGKKIINMGMLEKISPLSLAVWHMDDGHLEVKRKRIIIATDGFNGDDLGKLRLMLDKKFGIKTAVKEKKLLLNQKETAKFLEIIGKYKISCMRHKFEPLND